MKKNGTAVIKVAVFCFMMLAGAAWSADIPGVPNGTVLDTGTGLVWMQNADCFGKQDWDLAFVSAKKMKSGDCGLTDGSTAGQWRLPTKDELVARQWNRQGFNHIKPNYYWTSSDDTRNPGRFAWVVDMRDGGATISDKENNYNFVWLVRGGH